jgi:hypothetical protein
VIRAKERLDAELEALDKDKEKQQESENAGDK